MFNQEITIHIRKKSDPHDIETIEIYIETLKDLENIINRLVKTKTIKCGTQTIKGERISVITRRVTYRGVSTATPIFTRILWIISN